MATTDFYSVISRWVLIPPETPRTLVKPYQLEKGKHPDEAITWYTTVYKRVRASTWPKEYPVIEARQCPGETMFVPSGENTKYSEQRRCLVLTIIMWMGPVEL